MIKNKYLIYAFTYWCVFTQFLVGMIIPMIILISSNTKLHFVLYLFSFLILNVIIWFFIRKFLLQPIEIKISEEKLILRYLNFNTKKIKKELSTTFDKIEGFSDFSNGRDLKFKLYFKQGQSFTLYKSGLWNRKDDFEQLQYDFKFLIANLNNKIDTNDSGNKINKINKIKYGDNTYLNAALIFFGFSLFAALSFLSSVFDKSGEPINYKMLIGFSILLVLGLINLSIHRSAKIDSEKD